MDIITSSPVARAERGVAAVGGSAGGSVVWSDATGGGSVCDREVSFADSSSRDYVDLSASIEMCSPNL